MEKSDKIYMDALAAMLASRCNVTKKETQQFLTDFVYVIKEGIERDGLVKVKGLGTFKVIGIEPRESVNIRTGERVLIEGHQKISFTPDVLMKDLVNKPFSHFETVILNDGVDFPDEPEESEDSEEQEEPQEPLAEPAPVAAPVAAPVEEPEPAPEPEPEEEPELEPEPEPEALTPEPISTPIPQSEEPAPLAEPIAPAKSTPWWPWLVAALLACGLSFGAGYLLGTQKTPAEAPMQQQETPADTIVSTPVAAPVDTLTQDTMETPEPATVDQPAPEPAQPATETQQPAQPATETQQPADWQRYDAMDQRIRLGYYGIVGLDREVSAKEGETLGHLSRRILGPDMECYVEAFNGMKSTDVLTAGQTIKIPKLVSKKRLKQKNN